MHANVAVLGLGEAGSRYAADLLARGVSVAGYDPAPASCPTGLRRAPDPAEAVCDAAIVLSLNTASAAGSVARAAASGLRPGAVFADLNTASPRVKRDVAAEVEGTGALFTDVAALAPVPRSGLRTPLALAGPGRARLAGFLEPFDVPIEDCGPEPGAAAGRKLLRSVFMKGLAAVLMEGLDVAARAGQEDWLRDQIVEELTAADGALVDRLVEGTRRHAARRLAEMRAASEYADELGAASPVVRAVIARLEGLAADRGER